MFKPGYEDLDARATPVSGTWEEFKVGSNLSSEYVPFYSLAYRQVLDKFKEGYIYFKSAKSTYAALNQYASLFDYLNKGKGVKGYGFTVDDVPYTLTVRRGFLMGEDGKILMMLGISDYKRPESQDDFKGKIKLFITNEFTNNPLYKNVYKRVDKDYISEAREKGVTIEYTTAEKLEKATFNAYPPLHYKSIADLSELKQKYLRYFRYSELLDNSKYVRGMDRVVKHLIKPGYTINNLRTDDEFQPLLWYFIKEPVFDINTFDTASLDSIIHNAEESGIEGEFNATIEGGLYRFYYIPDTHTIKCDTSGKTFRLRLVENDMFTTLDSDEENTFNFVKNYISFVESQTLEGSASTTTYVTHTYTTASGGTYNIRIPEGFEITSSTDPSSIG